VLLSGQKVPKSSPFKNEGIHEARDSKFEQKAASLAAKGIATR
jgi:hypothetical protein